MFEGWDYLDWLFVFGLLLFIAGLIVPILFDAKLLEIGVPLGAAVAGLSAHATTRSAARKSSP